MAFGIDDFFNTAAGAINLADTVVQTIKGNKAKAGEVGLLLDEVKGEAIKRIDEAHEALNQFERLLKEKADLNQPLQSVIEKTSFWRPAESFRLWRAKRALDAMADSLFKCSEDVNALVRCMNDTGNTGQAIATSALSKHEFNRVFLDAKSVGDKICLLRTQLDHFRDALQS